MFTVAGDILIKSPRPLRPQGWTLTANRIERKPPKVARGENRRTAIGAGLAAAVAFVAAMAGSAAYAASDKKTGGTKKRTRTREDSKDNEDSVSARSRRRSGGSQKSNTQRVVPGLPGSNSKIPSGMR